MRIRNLLSTSHNSLFNAREYSLKNKQFFLTKADHQRRHDHYEYFYDLTHTVIRDRIMIAEAYQCEQFPEGLALLKDTLDFLPANDALTFTLERIHLIRDSKAAVEIFDALFNEEQLADDAGERLAYAKAIKPTLTNRFATDSVLARLHARDWPAFHAYMQEPAEKLTRRHT